ncbi:MAG TPA: AzlC family ABC transporter permease [Anaerolineaceae bacterium]|nr:AzlC family ABC transporter permease [Anaerolineaceae bacterium]HPN50698.1 AzlC family ABC transporter permease [Anaerolineaceae bacterium]
MPDGFSLRLQEGWAGVRAELPILAGVAPFGMIYGVLAMQAGLPVSAAQCMSFILFAGSSQFMAVPLLAGGVPALILIFTVFVINLRHALYSAALAPRLQHLSPLWKGLLAYLLTDEMFAVSITRAPGPLTHWFYLGAGAALWTCWQISTALGIFLGAQIPDSWSLDFSLPLTFIGLVVPALKDRPALLAALTAGLTAVLAYGLPNKLGLLLAALVGISAGLLGERLWKSG